MKRYITTRLPGGKEYIYDSKKVADKMIDYEAGRKKILSKWSKKSLKKRNAVPETGSHGEGGYEK